MKPHLKKQDDYYLQKAVQLVVDTKAKCKEDWQEVEVKLRGLQEKCSCADNIAIEELLKQVEYFKLTFKG